MTLTSGTVIDRITRVGDVGEPGYSAYGQSLRECTYSGSKDDWHGATQGSLSELLPTCYITESVYSYLTKAEIESVKDRILGIVPDLYAYRHSVSPSYGRSYRCWEFIDGIEARPLTHVPSDIMTTRIPDGTTVCFYGELAEIGGYNGIDHLIVDRDDGGPNIWSSNFTVGSCDTPYDIPDDETMDIPPVDDEYQPKSELATDLSSIFGDIDKKWIIIGLIAIALLGLLSG